VPIRKDINQYKMIPLVTHPKLKMPLPRRFLTWMNTSTHTDKDIFVITHDASLCNGHLVHENEKTKLFYIKNVLFSKFNLLI